MKVLFVTKVVEQILRIEWSIKNSFDKLCLQVLDGCKSRGKLGLIYCGDNERAKACLKQVGKNGIEQNL